MGQVFWTYVNCKSASAKALGEIARFNESYRGIEITDSMSLIVALKLP